MTLARCIREVMDHKSGILTQEWAEPIATVLVPVRTVSEANSHEHWRYRQKRAKDQHWHVRVALVAGNAPWNWDERRPFRELLEQEESAVTKRLDSGRLDELFDYGRFVQHVPAVMERLNSLESEGGAG